MSVSTVLLLAQRSPDMRAQMDERFEVHHVLDPLVPVPFLGLAHCSDVDDLLDAARAGASSRDAVGEIDRFLDRVGDEQHGARIDAAPGGRAPPA